jgi:hypothetical protein
MTGEKTVSKVNYSYGADTLLLVPRHVWSHFLNRLRRANFESLLRYDAVTYNTVFLFVH